MAVDRTLPTSAAGVAGQSPIDVYVDNELPAVYVETNLSETLNAAMTTMEVVTNCSTVSGGIVQGLNVTVTLGTSSYRGTTACGAYVKLDAGVGTAGVLTVSGRLSALEARLDIGAITENLSSLSVLCLDFSNAATSSIMNSTHASYICLRERSTIQKMPNIFDFKDGTTDAGNANSLFNSDATGATANTHTLRFIYNTVPYYIMVTSAPPTA